MAGHSRPKDGVASLAYAGQCRFWPSNIANMEMPATSAGMTDSI
jgi:hypothetical protein